MTQSRKRAPRDFSPAAKLHQSFPNPTLCHHWPMADAESTPEFDPGINQLAVEWPIPAGPAPLVNNFLLQGVLDADGGPGEILVRLGYTAPPPPGPLAAQPIQVTNVAAFTLSRARAGELLGYLNQQIDFWDQADEAARGKREQA